MLSVSTYNMSHTAAGQSGFQKVRCSFPEMRFLYFPEMYLKYYLPKQLYLLQQTNHLLYLHRLSVLYHMLYCPHLHLFCKQSPLDNFYIDQFSPIHFQVNGYELDWNGYENLLYGSEIDQQFLFLPFSPHS